MAERILYSETSLRPSVHHRATKTNIRSSIWPNGISGDLPIVTVRIHDAKDLPTIRGLLRCHEYLRLKGLIYDFVVVNEKSGSYFLELQESIQQTLRNSGAQRWINQHGGVFLLRSDITPEKDIAHIQAVARVSLRADEPIKDQLARFSAEEKYPAPLKPTHKSKKDPSPRPDKLNLNFFNGLGGFSQDGREYVILLKNGENTPAPWLNVISNSQEFGFQISESGAGFTWSKNSQTNRLSTWSNDPVTDMPGEIIYIRDEETGELWNPTPLPIRSEDPYEIRHGMGYSTFKTTSHGIAHALTIFASKTDSVKISSLKLENKTDRTRTLGITNYVEWVLGTTRQKTSPFLNCYVDSASRAIFANNPHDDEFFERTAFFDMSATDRSFSCSRKEFLGRNGDSSDPLALKRVSLSSHRGTDQDPCAALQTQIILEPGQSIELSFSLGQANDPESARKLALRYRDLKNVHDSLDEVRIFWIDKTSRLQVETPDSAMNTMINYWLIYQTLSCRFWARSAFYQSGGAFGFRDQLQDCMALIYSDAQLARAHILVSAGRQFKEGDVQHWWHPPTGRGVRTHMSDDLLWLPYVVGFYVRTTGDMSILEEKVAFLEAPLLTSEEDSYTTPKVSSESASVLEHCVRAIKKSAKTGAHGLPLMGTGDWNDSMNRVGHLGKGESIWLGWFLYRVLKDFLPLCQYHPDKPNLEAQLQSLKTSLDTSTWDGGWYKRAYFDDGTPLGSSANDECKIDSIAQSWAILSGAGPIENNLKAMEKAAEMLVRPDSRLILLFTPPFDQSPMDPGYIKGYLPGVRENGGQYTHAAVWLMMAFVELKNEKMANELGQILNPILRASNTEGREKYRLEPYVLAGDIYSGEQLEGRGGWSWYTGSSSWYYRAHIESILGFKLQGNRLSISPCIPKEWGQYTISYKYGQSKYVIQVLNPSGLSGGNVRYTVDGVSAGAHSIQLVDDQRQHSVVATLVIEAEFTSPDHTSLALQNGSTAF
ncbi:unnamed protein product [Sphagnum jensenii]|uniref:Uncharacterized protein n=1 Tax=Sphagnum jensenii TaxID=128206 RepID=A0ABP0VEK6_9BRYO